MAVKLNSTRKGVSIVWDVLEGGENDEVTVYAVGEDGDVHNKLPQKNTGEAGVFYPADFSGKSTIEIRDTEGNVLDDGEISV